MEKIQIKTSLAVGLVAVSVCLSVSAIMLFSAGFPQNGQVKSASTSQTAVLFAEQSTTTLGSNVQIITGTDTAASGIQALKMTMPDIWHTKSQYFHAVVDLTSANFDKLQFKIRTVATTSYAGSLKIRLYYSGSSNESKIDLKPYLKDGLVTPQYQLVSIPKEDFFTKNLNTSTPVFAGIFRHFGLDLTSADVPAGGISFYLDDITVTVKDLGATTTTPPITTTTTPATTTPTTTPPVVFNDSPSSSLVFRNIKAVNSSTLAHSGSWSFEVTPGNVFKTSTWLEFPPVTLGPTNKIEFYIRAKQGVYAKPLYVWLMSADTYSRASKMVDLSPYVVNKQITSTYQLVSIPLSAFVDGQGSFKRFSLSLGTGNVTSTFYLDDLNFIGQTVVCAPNWVTGVWSVCNNNTQTRTVTDANNCGVATNKPTTTQPCVSTTTPVTTASPATGSYQAAQNVTLVASEPATIYYCLGANCNPNLTYSSPIKISTSQALRFYARNLAGNAESVKTVSYTILAPCVENWTCGNWSTCSISTQTRTCTDANSCGTVVNRPALSQGCSPTGAVLNINAAKEIRDIYPTAIGGVEAFNRSADLWTIYDFSKDNNLKNMSWRSYVSDESGGWRWDSHAIDPAGSIWSWCETGLVGCADNYVPPDGFYRASYDDVVDYNQGNKFVVDYWGDATDMSHSATVVKTNMASNSAMRLQFAQTNPFYIRFDVKIDSAKTFNSDNSGWRLLNTNKAFDVYLTDDRRFDVRCIDSAYKKTQLSLSEPMALDKYYSFEIKYGQNECVYWVNGVEVDRKSLTTNLTSGVYIGSYNSSVSGAEGQLHLDAIRIDSGYIGNNVQYPWKHNYLSAITFDDNLRTIDDIASVAEKLGTTVIWQIPVPNKANPNYVENKNGWTWMTKQFYVDMVEYLNGTADADYKTKVNSLDWNHQTPGDNWANLRAYRGRVQPYNEIYFEFGNEPYYGGLWTTGYEAQYANLFNEYAVALKKQDSRIKLGLHFFYETTADITFPIAHDNIGFVSLGHPYSHVKGDSVIQWLGAPAANNNRWGYYMGTKGPWDNDTSYSSEERAHGKDSYYSPYMARYKVKQYLSDRSDFNSIFLATTEYGYFLAPGYGEENWLGTAINRAGWVGTLMQAGIKIGDAWTLMTKRFGHGILSSQTTGLEVSPSYYIYRLYADHFGSKLVDSQIVGGVAPYRATTTDNAFDYPYASAWTSLNTAKNKLYIMFINRQESSSTNVTINLSGFTPSGTARVYQVKGETPCSDNELTNEGSRLSSWCPASDGVNSSSQIVMTERAISVTGNSFSFSFPKLSVTAIEVDGAASLGKLPTPLAPKSNKLAGVINILRKLIYNFL
ncbi:MAG: chitobiase/beta-hexosaminidase C-terminal domain-containing protein [Patescibacteria group bacterium]